jgi:Zn-dependent M16 (insulinase) family peptidase
MGMIGSFPKEMSLTTIFKQMDGILGRLQNGVAVVRNIKTLDSLPKPELIAPGSIHIVDFPNKNDQQPGPLGFVWPASLNLENEELLLLELFIENLAGDPTTNLYKKFVDSKTREMDLGARGVFGWVVSEAGHPIYLGLSDVAPSHFNDEKIQQVRQLIIDEIASIANWSADATALQEFNDRLLSRVVESRRDTNKFINSPPGFGFRSTGASWMMYLDRLARTRDFRKSVTNRFAMEFVEQLLASKQNFWSDYITKWHLLDTLPHAGAARPNPELIAQEEQERQQRIDAEISRLKQVYQIDNDQEAIRHYRAEYDKASAELDQLERQSSSRFLAAPPLTLDDQLDYQVSTLPGEIKLVTSTFDNMTSATLGLALKLNGVPEEKLFYLSMLPTLLTRVGVIEQGRPISYEEMSEMMRKEILALNAYFSQNYRSERCELIVRGSGNDTREARRAVEWMKLVLVNPDWRPENLPRIRDLVDQILSGFRNTMQGAEESWVNNPAAAYRKQDNPLLLATDSFLTRTHNVHRLRWLLKDTDNDTTRAAISDYLLRLATAAQPSEQIPIQRGELKQLITEMRVQHCAVKSYQTTNYLID